MLISSPSFLKVLTPLASLEDFNAKSLLCEITREPHISNSGGQDCERKEFYDILLGKAEERGEKREGKEEKEGERFPGVNR